MMKLTEENIYKGGISELINQLDDMVGLYDYPIAEAKKIVDVINNRVQIEDISEKDANNLASGGSSCFFSISYPINLQIRDFYKCDNDNRSRIILSVLSAIIKEDQDILCQLDYRINFLKEIIKSDAYNYILDMAKRDSKIRDFMLKNNLVSEVYFQVTKFSDLIKFNSEDDLYTKPIYEIIKKIEKASFEACEYDVDSEIPDNIKIILSNRIKNEILSEEDVKLLTCPYEVVKIDYPIQSVVRDFNKIPLENKFFIARKIIKLIVNIKLFIEDTSCEYIYLKKYFDEGNIKSAEELTELLSNDYFPECLRQYHLVDETILNYYDEIINKFNNIRFKPTEKIVNLSYISNNLSYTDEHLALIFVEMSKKGFEIVSHCAGNHPFKNGFHCCNVFAPQESFFIIKRKYTEEEKHFLSKFKDFHISYERIEHYDYDVALIASCLPNREENSYFDYMKMCILNDDFLRKLYTYFI